MEKTATYTVISPHPNRRVWAAWGAVGVSVVALVVACMAAAVVNEQSNRVNRVEERLMEMESHIEDILRLMIENNEYDNKEYDDLDDDGDEGDYMYYDYNDPDKKDEITVRRVLRRKRQANSIDNEVPDSANVPIFDQSYGVNLQTHRRPNGLKLYDSLLSTDDETQVEETTPESTESPIKPHHRVSSLWKRRPRLPNSSGPPNLSARNLVRQIDSANGREDNELAEIFPGTPASQRRRSQYMERRASTKILPGTRKGLKSHQKQWERPNPTSNVVYRPRLVKSTSRHDSVTPSNSVVPQETLPEVVPQDQGRRTNLAFYESPRSSFYNKDNKKRRSKNRQHRRRRRGRPVLTLAHFGASPRNSTARPSLPGTGDHLDWNPAPWMNKLGLNTKYSMHQGTVTVREAGLYYIYAQVLYESGRANGGFQILVDDIPILECLAPALRPAPTCLTGGISYLPKNAEVKVRDLDNYLRTIHVPRNTFFGMIKLMDARNTAEEMLLA